MVPLNRLLEIDISNSEDMMRKKWEVYIKESEYERKNE